MKVLIIIPAYNEQDNIVNTIHDISSTLETCDYLVINDCSTDNTANILDENHFNHIDLPVNLGLSGAVQAGYKYAYINGYDCAVQFDGDGQHEAKFIPEMIQKIENGADIVIGSRFLNKKKDLSLRMIGSRILTFLIKMKTHKTITDPTSGMRMLNRKMLFDYAYTMNRDPEPDTLVLQFRHNAKIEEIQVSMKPRLGGASMYNQLWPSAKYMISMILSIIFLA